MLANIIDGGNQPKLRGAILVEAQMNDRSSPSLCRGPDNILEFHTSRAALVPFFARATPVTLRLTIYDDISAGEPPVDFETACRSLPKEVFPISAQALPFDIPPPPAPAQEVPCD